MSISKVNVFLFRHGHTNKIFQDHEQRFSESLSEKGREQANLLKQQLTNIQLAVHSGVPRSKETISLALGNSFHPGRILQLPLLRDGTTEEKNRYQLFQYRVYKALEQMFKLAKTFEIEYIASCIHHSWANELLRVCLAEGIGNFTVPHGKVLPMVLYRRGLNSFGLELTDVALNNLQETNDGMLLQQKVYTFSKPVLSLGEQGVSLVKKYNFFPNGVPNNSWAKRETRCGKN